MWSWCIGILAVVAGCEPAARVGPDVAEPITRVALDDECGHPLGPRGEIEFAATAAVLQTSYTPVTIANTGSEPILMAEEVTWTFEGRDAGSFEIDAPTLDPSGIGTCSYRWPEAKPLLPGESCRLGLRFRPQYEGPWLATLHARGGGLDQSFAIIANGIAAAPGVRASTPELFVTRTPPGKALGFEIINSGATSAPVGLALWPDDFYADWDCPASLAPGERCTVQPVTFNAASTNVHGCPTGTFTTTSGAVIVPLSTVRVP